MCLAGGRARAAPGLRARGAASTSRCSRKLATCTKQSSLMSHSLNSRARTKCEVAARCRFRLLQVAAARRFYFFQNSKNAKNLSLQLPHWINFTHNRPTHTQAAARQGLPGDDVTRRRRVRDVDRTSESPFGKLPSSSHSCTGWAAPAGAGQLGMLTCLLRRHTLPLPARTSKYK